ncbi:MAG: ABC transporter permease [Myxococcales bacterium]|nr:ABC transporter permease [Myxococcales bacterium]
MSQSPPSDPKDPASPSPPAPEGKAVGTGAPVGADPAASLSPRPTAPISDKAAAALAAFEAEEKKQEKERTRAPAAAAGPFARLLDMMAGFFRNFFVIRDEPTIWGKALMAGLCLLLIFLAWQLVTGGGASEERIVSRTTLGSPAEVFGSFPSLWADDAGRLILLDHLMASLLRVLEGFLLAILIGVPLGILCGTFKRIDAFFAPISIFGRNVPISALVPLTLLWFGIGEAQKVGFIFIACVAFVLFDSARAVSNVGKDYLDTAYTLGASRRQVMTKVLIPLAMPDVFNTIRLMFGLAFGYIILAEAIDADKGVGKLIMLAQRRGPREHVYLILLFLTVVAFLLDRFLWFCQKQLFPYRYGRG